MILLADYLLSNRSLPRHEEKIFAAHSAEPAAALAARRGAAPALSRSAAGKGRGASYAMARNGKMPVVDVGGTKIVPRAPWLIQLGADPDTFESVGSGRRARR